MCWEGRKLYWTLEAYWAPSNFSVPSYYRDGPLFLKGDLRSMAKHTFEVVNKANWNVWRLDCWGVERITFMDYVLWCQEEVKPKVHVNHRGRPAGNICFQQLLCSKKNHIEHIQVPGMGPIRLRQTSKGWVLIRPDLFCNMNSGHCDSRQILLDTWKCFTSAADGRLVIGCG